MDHFIIMFGIINLLKRIIIISDLADNKFLEVAKESSADYLITGNFRDFTFDKFENTIIVSQNIILKILNLNRVFP
ncbi:MAG: hypothetical protein IPN93_11965 [Bacteroidetes bacterium]|nr:hypothetical protein [Bacteroidota bacterium]